MNQQLIDEATELHRAIVLAILVEERRYDVNDHPRKPDLARIERLEHAKRRAADRWRRRSGYAYHWPDVHRRTS